MKFFQRINTIHLAIAFIISFCLYILFILVAIQKVSWHRVALKIHFLWARTLFLLFFTRVKVEWRYKPDKNLQFIVCSNHFSFIDIPAISYLPYPIKFIGKSSLSNIPVFGYMYRKLHIPVNRSSFKSRAMSLNAAREMIDLGFNIGFYPEGGIRSKKIPQMADFKDGAFRLAVEKQIPIIPITLPDNYLFLPDDGKLYVSRRSLRVIVHPPIFPKSESDTEIEYLKKKTFETIQMELNQKCGNN